ncbi:MAG: YggS family pyridoxal phosphate-dependent enzyme [bacterium]
MAESFAERLAGVEARLAAACARVGRARDEVRLLTVTKTQGPDEVAVALAAGLTLFGENRVQEARSKIPLCAAAANWHLIGHLQSNKVKEAVQLFALLQAVDSLRLLELIDGAAAGAGRTLPVYLEVNVSGERSKNGLAPEFVPGVLAAANRLTHVDIQGLMTIPPLARDVGEARPFFRRLRELRDEWRRESGLALAELSMGMSHDFEIAVEEGATMVRVGSALFGPRPPKGVSNDGNE